MDREGRRRNRHHPLFVRRGIYALYASASLVRRSDQYRQWSTKTRVCVLVSGLRLTRHHPWFPHQLDGARERHSSTILGLELAHIYGRNCGDNAIVGRLAGLYPCIRRNYSIEDAGILERRAV